MNMNISVWRSREYETCDDYIGVFMTTAERKSALVRWHIYTDGLFFFYRPHTDKVSLGRSIQMSDIVSSVAVEKTDTGNPPLHLSADTHLQSILVRSKT